MEEDKTKSKKSKIILGIDEAGRGPVIGSMFIGGVLIDSLKAEELKEQGVNDSKLLAPKKRSELYKKILKAAAQVESIEIPALEIDERRKVMSLNELEAMKMAELIEKFKAPKPEQIVIDLPDPTAEGFVKRIKKYTTLPCDVVAEHKADVNHPCVSAASIVAKVRRDKHVKELEKIAKEELGNGYPHDPLAIAFIEKCAHAGEYPDFVRKSWDTTKRIKEKKHQRKLDDFK